MKESRPPVVCIVGRKDSGKTELTVRLAGELGRRGLGVMTVKHGHGFTVDQAGKDSWRHRHEGGALRTVLAGPADFAVIGRWPGEEMSLSELVDRFLWDADIVLAEGFKAAGHPAVEVFREAPGAEPLCRETGAGSSKIIALVTDGTGIRASIPVFRLGADGLVSELADFLEGRFPLTRSGA
jgi:molybdopterin-guanine dinucleotide biosynthesis protein B